MIHGLLKNVGTLLLPLCLVQIYVTRCSFGQIHALSFPYPSITPLLLPNSSPIGFGPPLLHVPKLLIQDETIEAKTMEGPIGGQHHHHHHHHYHQHDHPQSHNHDHQYSNKNGHYNQHSHSHKYDHGHDLSNQHGHNPIHDHGHNLEYDHNYDTMNENQQNDEMQQHDEPDLPSDDHFPNSNEHELTDNFHDGGVPGYNGQSAEDDGYENTQRSPKIGGKSLQKKQNNDVHLTKQYIIFRNHDQNMNGKHYNVESDGNDSHQSPKNGRQSLQEAKNNDAHLSKQRTIRPNHNQKVYVKSYNYYTVKGNGYDENQRSPKNDEKSFQEVKTNAEQLTKQRIIRPNNYQNMDGENDKYYEPEGDGNDNQQSPKNGLISFQEVKNSNDLPVTKQRMIRPNQDQNAFVKNDRYYTVSRGVRHSANKKNNNKESLRWQQNNSNGHAKSYDDPQNEELPNNDEQEKFDLQQKKGISGNLLRAKLMNNENFHNPTQIDSSLQSKQAKNALKHSNLRQVHETKTGNHEQKQTKDQNDIDNLYKKLKNNQRALGQQKNEASISALTFLQENGDIITVGNYDPYFTIEQPLKLVHNYDDDMNNYDDESLDNDRIRGRLTDEFSSISSMGDIAEIWSFPPLD